jgi:hypothetical protein
MPALEMLMNLKLLLSSPVLTSPHTAPEVLPEWKKIRLCNLPEQNLSQERRKTKNFGRRMLPILLTKEIKVFPFPSQVLQAYMLRVPL